MRKVVVVGGGQAGHSVVAKLVSLGFDGKISLIAEEPCRPYQRPPLSKKYLLGEMDEARLYLKPTEYYGEHGVRLLLGASCEGIDRSSRTVAVGGETIPYDDLVLATGSIPRKLPEAIGGALPGVHVVRTIADIKDMAPDFVPGAKVLVVGGGYIGLEAASAAVAKGLSVCVVEMAERILQRVAASETSDFIRNLHLSRGVELLESVGLTRLLGENGLTGALLSDGTELDLDMAIIGVGIVPSTGLAESAGLKLDNGIWTDANCRTADPAIWAAGDCASFPWKGKRIRLESVQNAIDQAECVAENIMGAEKEYHPTPWFWSDQYDAKLQIAGLCTGYDRVVVRPGRTDDSISHWYYRGSELLAVDAVNDSRAYMIGKRLLETGKTASPEEAADPACDLKSLLRRS